MSTYGIKHADYVNAEVEINLGRKLIINLCTLVDSAERTFCHFHAVIGENCEIKVMFRCTLHEEPTFPIRTMRVYVARYVNVLT